MTEESEEYSYTSTKAGVWFLFKIAVLLVLQVGKAFQPGLNQRLMKVLSQQMHVASILSSRYKSWVFKTNYKIHKESARATFVEAY